MRQPTIRAIAVTAVMSCAALCPPRLATAGDGDGDIAFGDAEPAIRVDSHRIAAPIADSATPASEEPPPFIWTTDLSLAPPPHLRTSIDSHFAAPATSGIAVPLPPAIWTGFASLAGLGAIALVRKTQHRR